MTKTEKYIWYLVDKFCERNDIANEIEKKYLFDSIIEFIPEWVSVEVSLPECWVQHGKDYSSGYVLGFTKYGDIEQVELWEIYNEKTKKYDREWKCNDLSHGYITHWMELPDTPNRC